MDVAFLEAIKGTQGTPSIASSQAPFSFRLLLWFLFLLAGSFVRYFHGQISRDEATARLKERGTDGVFLVRTGSTGGAVISIL